MSRKTLAMALALAALVSAPASGQRKKEKTKEKRFEPAVLADVRDLAGRYAGIDDTYYLEIEVGADGLMSATSHEGGRRATLGGIRLDGARLTATKTYADGSTAPFEGLFVNRIRNGRSAFGMMVEGLRIEFEGLTFDRLFYGYVKGTARPPVVGFRSAESLAA